MLALDSYHDINNGQVKTNKVGIYGKDGEDAGEGVADNEVGLEGFRALQRELHGDGVIGCGILERETWI